ncbi:orotidine-5'-phosphate decarboxylase [Dethiosulfatibacter aminovorans DSM 17477]|uniref:Orotidine 5'-phosphate decarboxylase n=1 Tax=Dethiosulfatibacter aminovorans DSM 17477 TaxID=1121476 RepID=A0A1M6AGM8_9FIRM|nr:orotidine-5'-phosphate decarboxylase [Dethiosulfatibacter aminovorans]SHI35649.1 orotidine-5'-phosphate decarboxylase [Dethiosulfatibacter aminovorans DSM 17477]
MIVDKLYRAVEEKGHVCVGLDTDYSYLPSAFASRFETKGEAIFEFNKEIIDRTHDKAACFKVQVAYYEALGLEGLKAYSDTLKYIKEKGSISICDIKRGDIMKTAEMYAKAHFTGDFEGDFITLNAYMGVNDSLEPFLDYIKNQDKGIFVLVRTSNQGARDFQYIKNEEGKYLYSSVGEKLQELSQDYLGECGFSSIGGVVGCTNNEEGIKLREEIKSMFLLIPGYGAQGGGAKDVVPYLINGNGGVVNSSRGIITAYKKDGSDPMDFAKAAERATVKMRDEIREELKK